MLEAEEAVVRGRVRGKRALVICVVAVLASIGVACSDDGGAGPTEASTADSAARCETTLAVFFEPEITDEALDEAAGALAALEEVVGVDVIDHEEAAAEARRLFADDPSTLELIERSPVPPSVRIEVSSAAAQQRVAEGARGLPLVRNVTLSQAPPESVLDALGQAALENWCG